MLRYGSFSWFRNATLSYDNLCLVVPGYATLRHARPRYAMITVAILCLAMLCLAMVRRVPWATCLEMASAGH